MCPSNIRCLDATPALPASISLFDGLSRFAATSWNFCRDFDDDEKQNGEPHSHAASCLIDHGIVDQRSPTILYSEFLSAILWRLCRARRALPRAISAFLSSFGPLSNTTMQMPMSQSHKTSKSHKTQMQNAPRARMQCKEKKEKGQNGSPIKYWSINRQFNSINNNDNLSNVHWCNVIQWPSHDPDPDRIRSPNRNRSVCFDFSVPCRGSLPRSFICLWVLTRLYCRLYFYIHIFDAQTGRPRLTALFLCVFIRIPFLLPWFPRFLTSRSLFLPVCALVCCCNL